MMKAIVNLKGKIVAPEDAQVSVFDRGFLFGDGVYETGKSLERCCLFLEEHLNRLRRSASKLKIPVPLTDQEWTEEIFKTARAFGQTDAYFRIILSRGVGSALGLEFYEDLMPTWVIIFQSLSSKLSTLQEKGVQLLTSKIVRNSSAAQDPDIKTSNYLNSLLALQEVKTRGGEDAVLCDSLNRVAEGTTFSVFGVRGTTLITPSLKVGILDSITRRHVLEVGRSFLSLEEGFFSLSEFQKCEEVFIASSVREIVPVREWDGKKYRAPSPVTERLKMGLKSVIRGYIESHPRY